LAFFLAGLRFAAFFFTAFFFFAAFFFFLATVLPPLNRVLARFRSRFSYETKAVENAYQ
jgi:hypothetical protein